MIEELKQTLDRFDKDTVQYLESNKYEIFKSISVNKGIPQEIGLTLAVIFSQREIIIEAIDKLEKTSPQ
jgi:hypothetical protein